MMADLGLCLNDVLNNFIRIRNRMMAYLAFAVGMYHQTAGFFSFWEQILTLL